MGSKSIFRACQAKGLIDEKALNQLLEMVELRNRTAHVYDGGGSTRNQQNNH